MLEHCELAADIGSFRARVNDPRHQQELAFRRGTESRDEARTALANDAPLETE